MQLRRWLSAFAVAGLVAGCAEPPVEVDDEADPNEGLLRDFIDGKYDAAGHPLNAKVLAARDTCTGPTSDGIVEVRGTCEIALPDGAASGGLTVNARIRVRQHPSAGPIATLTAVSATGARLGSETLTAARLRGADRWIDLPISIETSVPIVQVLLEVAPAASVELEYVEVFPKRLGVVVSPGSGVYADTDEITFELPRGKKIERLQADGVDVEAALARLLDDGLATRTTTSFRTLITVKVGDLVPARGEVTELRVHASGDTSRMQLRRAPAPCEFVGDPAGTKVLVTGFQPFPADGWHENVSAVAVTAMDPDAVRGAQVMRLVLPVEYDHAAAAIADVIDRCAPVARDQLRPGRRRARARGAVLQPAGHRRAVRRGPR